MSTAEEPGRRHDESGADLSATQAGHTELDTFESWLPVATPTEGQPYKEIRHLKEHPPSAEHHIIHPRGIDASGSMF